MFDLQTLIHYSLHFLVPGVISFLFFKKIWKHAWLIMIATMLIDADHLLAEPIFEAGRCSIGFHPLHSTYAIIAYFLLFFVPNKYAKIVAIGLLFHVFTDFIDCIQMGTIF